MTRAAYVYACAGCGLLCESERRDTLTCSPACRVRAPRNGSLKTLRDIAKQWEIRPATIGQAQAVRELCPDLADRLRQGELKLDSPEIMRAVYAEFVKRVMAAAPNVSGETLHERAAR
jgi:hypothetical protein